MYTRLLLRPINAPRIDTERKSNGRRRGRLEDRYLERNNNREFKKIDIVDIKMILKLLVSEEQKKRSSKYLIPISISKLLILRYPIDHGGPQFDLLFNFNYSSSIRLDLSANTVHFPPPFPSTLALRRTYANYRGLPG